MRFSSRADGPEGVRRQSTTLEVLHRHEKLAPESGVEFLRPIAPISGADFRSVCQWSKARDLASDATFSTHTDGVDVGVVACLSIMVSMAG